MAAGLRDEAAIAPEVDDLLDAVRAVDGEGTENREVDEQDDPIEGVELVKQADVAPGFVDQVVEVALKKCLWRRPQRSRPGRRIWGLQNHRVRLTFRSGFC